MTASKEATLAKQRRGEPSLAVGPTHVRSIDGIRFFAFLGVFAFHSLQSNHTFGLVAAYGALGVQVFFVLSGFLIGGILLDLREQTDIPLGVRLKTFYIRRALRIFPLYYAVLILIALLPLVGITAIGGNDSFGWNAAYLTNVKIYLDQRSMGGLSHFWSLSVEEHFYFISPLLMLTVPIRWLKSGFVVLWVACGAARVFFALHGNDKAELLSPLQFDCMTIGIGFAMLNAKREFLGVSQRAALRLSALCGLLALPLFALRHASLQVARLAGHAVEQWVFCVAIGGLVLSLWNSSFPALSRLLTRSPLPYLGKISYGLYVFHYPCLLLAALWLKPFMGHGTAIPGFIAALALAAFSWRFFEGPINDQKRHFPYRARH